MDAWKKGFLGKRLKRPSLVTISPPCEGFSAGISGGKDDEKNNDLVSLVNQIAEIIDPHWLVMENVVG